MTKVRNIVASCAMVDVVDVVNAVNEMNAGNVNFDSELFAYDYEECKFYLQEIKNEFNLLLHILYIMWSALDFRRFHYIFYRFRF